MRKIETDILTLDEVVQILRVKKAWIYQRTRPKSIRGGIPHFRIGRLLRFDRIELLFWLSKMHRTGNPAVDAYRRLQETKPRRIH